MKIFDLTDFADKMEAKHFEFYKVVDEETGVFQVSASKYKFLKILEDDGLALKNTYHCIADGLVRQTTTVISTHSVDEVVRVLTVPPAITGTYYVYAQKAGHIGIAFTEVLAKKYPVSSENYFVDDAGSTEKLEELLKIVNKGDAVIVGTITDFMTHKNIDEMLGILEQFNELGVIICSRLEPDYDIVPYRSLIRLADRISRIRDGEKAI